ncbi:hypothetical protein [Jannaschia sp. R86511]|uniref:hypothetical protein n=1 Tax=Jannaschia sp. R86511 TaxID=3093853 RepID=UPI0036D220F6
MSGPTTDGAAGPDEQAYAADARRWLRAYPPRWRRAREDEVLGLLLDTRPAGARRVRARTGLDLARGALAYRWRTRPRFVAWLLWRWNDTLPGRAHREWLLDDLNGRFWGFRQAVLGFPGLVALAFLLTATWTGGRWLSWWLLLPVVVVAYMSLAWPMRWRRRTVLRQLADVDRQQQVATSFDGSVPWQPRVRWAWTDRLLWAALAPLVTAPPLLAVTAWWWWAGAPGTPDLDLAPFGSTGLVPLVLLLTSTVVPLVAMPARVGRRLADRPAQPWRRLVPVPLLLVVPVAVAAAVLPLLAAALPLGQAFAALTGWGPPGTWGGDTSWAALVPLLVVWGVSVAALLTHRQVVRARRTGPPPALVDVWSARGGDDVLPDTPVVLFGHEFVAYPPAPGGPGPASAGHH